VGFMPKRSLVSESRLKQLQQQNARYIISCYQNEFYCENHPDGKCTRGFFSLFLQVVYGIGFAKQHGIPFYVDFGNLNYPYSSRKEESTFKNFWEELFTQPSLTNTDIQVINKQFEVYPLRIWNRDHLRELNALVSTGIKFNEALKTKIEEIKINMAKLRTLGVHFRKTDHFLEVRPASNEVFFRQIKNKLPGYDQLFVATDDCNILEILKKKFPEKIWAHDCVRSTGSLSIHHNEEHKDGVVLAKEALLDCITLSYCDELILSPSNLSYAALVFNPEIKYSIIESKVATWKRLKTLLAFHLNRLGIRKW
tara:strand:+ start:105553 stop:106482 length:930 start_codon:yes stop_codon:yes gene_type:complete